MGLMTNIGCIGDFGKVAGSFTIYTYWTNSWILHGKWIGWKYKKPSDLG